MELSLFVDLGCYSLFPWNINLVLKWKHKFFCTFFIEFSQKAILSRSAIHHLAIKFAQLFWKVKSSKWGIVQLASLIKYSDALEWLIFIMRMIVKENSRTNRFTFVKNTVIEFSINSFQLLLRFDWTIINANRVYHFVLKAMRVLQIVHL